MKHISSGLYSIVLLDTLHDSLPLLTSSLGLVYMVSIRVYQKKARLWGLATTRLTPAMSDNMST